MPTLRVTQTTLSPGQYQVELAVEEPRKPRKTATAHFAFAWDDADRTKLQWYLETYPQYPQDPAPMIAAGVERRMVEIGTALFRAVFQADDDTRDLWAKVRDQLNQTRVEIITSVQEATAIPWELLRDPKTDTPLALAAQAFVRTDPNPAREPQVPRTSTPIRILLVISRPKQDDDVPFRSVAGQLVKAVSGREDFQLDVLRPPTFKRLGEVLRAAKAAGKPYHVVHFDGHGVYLELPEAQQMAALLKMLGTATFAGPGPRAGAHGYLAFENPAKPDNMDLIGGPDLGKLLVETRVPVLVLNACQSAFAESQEDPNSQIQIPNSEDSHAQVRAYGSLAQEVIDAGVTGVVAMRYSVYVVTAAQFIADLYAALTAGAPLGEAVTFGRKQLAENPRRDLVKPITLQDWPVPVVYEAAPVALFKRAAGAAPLKITLAAGQATPGRGRLDQELPPPPDAGFYGRDETLLALDRAFDTQAVVLLHAYAGSGKTSTAAEFARWYSLTGGVAGPVLFTSFEQYKPLAQVLGAIERVFGPALEQQGVHLLAITDDRERQEVVLQVLRQVPMLWIWDNVERVAGFPAGTRSDWYPAEQQELRDFLRAARQTRAKFLLTSRRDERAWLGDLPARIAVPPMPMQERALLARALAEKHGRRLTDIEDWRPLLAYTRGNPMTITVVVGQALRDGIRTREQVDAYVARLRAGEPAFADEASEGRTRSLGASLSYGFEHAFSDAERRQLALLHFFQGFVDVDVLRVMGGPEFDWCLDSVRGLTRAAGMALLDRAAEAGLLTAHGGGYYSIHPALPWYFKALFDQYYPEGLGSGAGETEHATRDTQLAATRAFVEAEGSLGDYYHNQYGAGNRDVIGVLGAEETSLLHARRLARAHGWSLPVMKAMQGLRSLYGHTGRRAEWARLVAEIVPDFVDPDTDGPLPGREEEWSLVTEYRERRAREARQWAEAERLQRAAVEWDRRQAAPALATPTDGLDSSGRNAIRSLAVSLEELGNILRELERSDCVGAYEEAIPLCQRIDDRPEEAVIAINLGHAYLTIPAIRDLAQAERCYRRSLKLTDEGDRQGQAIALSQLGLVAYEHFEEARAAKQPEEELLHHLNTAATFYEQALKFDPPDALDDLAVDHNQLGNIYREAGDPDRAVQHYREAIRYREASGNLYGAAQTRGNVAIALAGAGRFADALLYAQAALRNFATYGDRAAEVDQMQRLIELIQQAEQAAKGGQG